MTTMTKCAKCKRECSKDSHVVKRDIGSDSTRKRYPTMKVCDECFVDYDREYKKEPKLLKKSIYSSNKPADSTIRLNQAAKPLKLQNKNIEVALPVDIYVDTINPEKNISRSTLEEVMIRDLPNFEIERRCTRCGKWFDVTVNTNQGDMRVATQLCPHCKNNNQIYIRIKRIDDIDKLRENAKNLS